MPSTPMAANVSKPLDVQRVESSEVSLNSVLVYLLTQDSKLFFIQIPYSLALNALHNGTHSTNAC